MAKRWISLRSSPFFVVFKTIYLTNKRNNNNNMKGLYFYKLVSPYSEDVTKNCRLTVNEIDGNFLNLKDEDIKSAEFDCEAKVLTLTRNNGETLQADMSCAWQGLTSNFDVTFDESGCTGSGVLRFTWDEDGEKHEATITGLVTKDNIGNYVMTEAITDGTIIGNGRDGNPLSLNPIEQTGHYKPVIDLRDMTNGESLPTNNELGDRYLTLEKVDDYGHLYNIDGVKELEAKLSNGWRIPTKADWDNMLNAIEPCAYRNHQSHDCHIELGKVAGKELKTANDWPFDPATSAVTDDTAYLFEEVVPSEKPINTRGTNKYGFSALPTGFAYEKGGEIQKFGMYTSFWTNTQTMSGARSDYYVKTLMHNKAGVWQSAECPFDYRSVRLVKDYDGSNARESAYIGGKYYEEVLLPSMNSEHKFAIWTKTNVDIEVSDQNQIKYSDYNDNDDSYNTKAHNVYVINEWTGKDWERKIMPEGGVIVINNEQCRTLNGKEFQYDADTEFRLVKGELKATDELVFDKVWEKIGAIILNINNKISAETAARITADEALSDAITDVSNALDDEINRAKEAESGLSNAIKTEETRAKEAESGLSDAIKTEKQERITADEALSGAIKAEETRAKEAESGLSDAITDVSNALDVEINRAKEAESGLSNAINAEETRATAEEGRIKGLIHQGGLRTIPANGNNVVIPSYDDKEEHKITLNFDGNFGEI